VALAILANDLEVEVGTGENHEFGISVASTVHELPPGSDQGTAFVLSDWPFDSEHCDIARLKPQEVDRSERQAVRTAVLEVVEPLFNRGI
jgi:hypothetical protein